MGRVTITRGTVLKGHGIGKAEDRCSRGYIHSVRGASREQYHKSWLWGLPGAALGPGQQCHPCREASPLVAHWASVSFSEQHSSAMPSVLMPASPCQLSGEWLPNFNHSWFPTASKCFATSPAAGTGQAHRCQDKGWPRQPLPAAQASQRAPLTGWLRCVSSALRR